MGSGAEGDPGRRSCRGCGGQERAVIQAAGTCFRRRARSHLGAAAGMADRYLDLLQPWREMLAKDLTTTPEFEDPTRSDTHAWSAHPNFDLLRIVAGIRPKSAGFETIAIEPHLGELKEVKAGMPIPRGMVEVEYKRTQKGVEARVKLPADETGEFVWKGKAYSLREGEQKFDLP